MDEDEDILVVKSPVYLFNIPLRLQRRKCYIHRATDWDVKNPSWHGKISLIAAGPNCCHLQLEDFDGDIYAQAVIESYPTPIIQPVMDSKRFFVIEIQNISGDHELVGIGYNTRNDSGEFIDTLEQYFTKTDAERVKRAASPSPIKTLPPSKKAKTEEVNRSSEAEPKVEKKDPATTGNETEASSTNGHRKSEESSSMEHDRKAEVKSDADNALVDVKGSEAVESAPDVMQGKSEPGLQKTSAVTANVDSPIIESVTTEVSPEVPMDIDTTDRGIVSKIVSSAEQLPEKKEIPEAGKPADVYHQKPLVSNTSSDTEKENVDNITAATEAAQQAVSEVVTAAESAAADARDVESSTSVVEPPADIGVAGLKPDNVEAEHRAVSAIETEPEPVVITAMEIEPVVAENSTSNDHETGIAMDQELTNPQNSTEAPVQEVLAVENEESDVEPQSMPSLGATLQSQDSLDLLTAGIDANEALDLDVLETAVLPLEETTEFTQQLEDMGTKGLLDVAEPTNEPSSNFENSMTTECTIPVMNQSDDVENPVVQKQPEAPSNGAATIEPETAGGIEVDQTTENIDVVEEQDSEIIKEEDDEEQEKEVECEEQVDESEDPLAGAEPASEATLPVGYKYQTEPGGAFNCHKCPETLATYNLMKRHWSTIHNFKQASHCPVCLLPFPNKVEVSAHKLDVHGFKCDDCGKQFAKDQGLREHQRQSHSKINLLQCPHCEAAFKVKFQLVKHIEAEHEDDSSEACIHQCSVCNQKFVTEEELNVHKQKHEGSSGCPHCTEWTFSGPRMASKKKLAEHIRKTHPDQVESLGPRRVSTRGHKE